MGLPDSIEWFIQAMQGVLSQYEITVVCVWRQWYESGQLKLEANYKAWREHSSFTQWHDNGKKRVEANFVNGKKEGTETAWNKDGSLRYTATYKDGQEIK